MGDLLLQFHKSFAEELIAKRDRVRNLIGSVHWGEEGRYKEIILRSSISQYIPQPYRASTGFVIDGSGKISKQLDIIVHHTMIPPYFKEQDFVVIPKQAMLAFVEVKTRIRRVSELKRIFSKFKDMYSEGRAWPSIFSSTSEQNRVVAKNFRGVFSYDTDFDLRRNSRQKRELIKFLKAVLQSGDLVFDHITLGHKYFIKLHRDAEFEVRYCIYDLGKLAYAYYDLGKLAYAYFLSNLLHTLSEHSSTYFGIDYFNEQYNFRFPIREGKVAYEIACVHKDRQGEG